MIKCIGIRAIQLDIEASYTPEIKTYNIVSSLMSDTCQPYRVAQSAMLWLNEDGFLGEIECIYPEIITFPFCQSVEEPWTKDGFPQFEIHSCDNVSSVQHCGEGFLVWLAREKTIDGKIHFKNISFFLAEDELVAIQAHQASIVK